MREVLSETWKTSLERQVDKTSETLKEIIEKDRSKTEMMLNRFEKVDNNILENV